MDWQVDVFGDWTYVVEMVPVGWECPKCGRVYAPHVQMCGFCSNPLATHYSTVTVDIPPSGVVEVDE